MKDKPTILIIEDDRTLQELYAERFILAGFDVLQAFDGEQGLEMLENNPQVDVITVDLMLPRLSGYDIISRIRGDALKRDIPIVVITALEDDESQKKSLEAGANECFSKSGMLLGDIVDQVKRYL